MTTVVLGLGANLGDRWAALSMAARSLGHREISDVYETLPWGDADQPSYLNLVMTARDSSRTPEDWLDAAEACMTAAGRVRDPARRYGPRVLDVDLIAAYDGVGTPIPRDTARLTLPHPRAHLRAFVLVPWHEIDPDAELVGHGAVRDLLSDPRVAADARETRRLGPLLGPPPSQPADTGRG